MMKSVLKLAYYLEKMGYEALIIHADVPVDLKRMGGWGICR